MYYSISDPKCKATQYKSPFLTDTNLTICYQKEKNMKATGIVRRIDDLGRVVIPKEIRRTLRIREGDPLEIFTEKDGEVIFKKYSPIGELSSFASQYAETLSKTSGYPACITDMDTVIAVSGVPKRDFNDKKISDELEKIIEEKTSVVFKPESSKRLSIVDGSDKYLMLSQL